jgi:hypothetical protein
MPQNAGNQLGINSQPTTNIPIHNTSGNVISSTSKLVSVATTLMAQQPQQISVINGGNINTVIPQQTSNFSQIITQPSMEKSIANNRIMIIPNTNSNTAAVATTSLSPPKHNNAIVINPQTVRTTTDSTMSNKITNPLSQHIPNSSLIIGSPSYKVAESTIKLNSQPIIIPTTTTTTTYHPKQNLSGNITIVTQPGSTIPSQTMIIPATAQQNIVNNVLATTAYPQTLQCTAISAPISTTNISKSDINSTSSPGSTLTSTNSITNSIPLPIEPLPLPVPIVPSVHTGMVGVMNDNAESGLYSLDALKPISPTTVTSSGTVSTHQ